MSSVKQQRLIILAFIVFFFCVNLSFALEHPSFFKGYTQMNEGHYDEAIMYFNISVKADPDYLPAYSHLALCYERKEDFPMAIEAWQKYTKFDSYFKREVQTHIELTDKFQKAREYLKQTQINEALPLLEEIVALDKYPMSVLWLYAAKELGDVYFNNKDYDKAIGLYEKINLYYPKDLTEEILFRYAYSYQQGREFEKAIDIYKKLDKTFAIKDKENIKKYKNFVSFCYEGLGDEVFVQEEYKKAMDTYDIAIKGFSEADNIPGVSEKKQKAEENLAFFYKTEGDTYAQLKEYSKAIDFYEKIISDCPNTEKRAYAEDQIASLGEMEKKHLKQIYFYYDKGSYEQAREVCHISLKEFPEGYHAPLIQFLLGCTYSNREDYRKAIPEFLKLVKRYPESPLADDALDRIGIFYWYILGEKEKALKIFRYLLKKYPEGNFAPSALYHCGRLYSKAGNYRSAYLMFKRLIEKYPEDELLVRKANVQIQMIKEGIKKENTERK